MTHAYFCFICKADLSARVNLVSGSKRKRYPAHTRVTIHVSNGQKTVAAEVWACAEHSPPLQDALTSVGAKLPKLPPGPKNPRIEVVSHDSGQVIDTIQLSNTNERYVERVLSGLLTNMDTDKYFAREMDT